MRKIILLSLTLFLGVAQAINYNVRIVSAKNYTFQTVQIGDGSTWIDIPPLGSYFFDNLLVTDNYYLKYNGQIVYKLHNTHQYYEDRLIYYSQNLGYRQESGIDCYMISKKDNSKWSIEFDNITQNLESGVTNAFISLNFQNPLSDEISVSHYSEATLWATCESAALNG